MRRNNKITLKQMAFYLLYQNYKTTPENYVDVWKFVGELYIKELGKWVLMSYTCVHRAFEIFDENPGLVERQKVRGKSGARYFQYRIAPMPSADKIKDPSLLAFYNKIKKSQ